MNSNIEFLKTIIDKDILEHYLKIERMEANILHAKDISEPELFKLKCTKDKLLKDLLYTIKNEQLDLFFNELRLAYNSFSYKINMPIQSEDLEEITRRLKFVDKIVDVCLLKLNSVLKKMKKSKNNDKILTIYLYLLALINLKNECDKYYSVQVEIINNNLKKINAEFNNNHDIAYTLTNIERVKALILTFN